MVGINVVDPVIPYAFSNVRNVQVPVGVDHNTFGELGEEGNPPRKTLLLKQIIPLKNNGKPNK